MRSVPGAVETGSRHCQLPISDCRLQIGNNDARSLPLPVLTPLLQLFFVGEREFHQGIAAVNFEFVADVLAVAFDGAHADG